MAGGLGGACRPAWGRSLWPVRASLRFPPRSVLQRSNPSRHYARWLSGYACAMDASKLTPEQGRRLAETVGPMLGYVHRLAHWMQRVGWKPDDPLYVAAWDAHEALHALHVHARYASCKPGTAGRPSG